MLAGAYSPPRASDAGVGGDDVGDGLLAGEADAGHDAPPASESGGIIGGRKRHATEAFGEESMLGREILPVMPDAIPLSPPTPSPPQQKRRLGSPDLMT